MTPAVSVSVNFCRAGSISMSAPQIWRLRSPESPINDNQGVILKIDNCGVNRRKWDRRGNRGNGVGTTQDEVGRRTGAGPIIVDGKAEAIAELMLEVAQCFFRIRRPEDRAHYQLGRRCVRFHAKPRAAWSAHRAADRPDAAYQPSAHAAAGG